MSSPAPWGAGVVIADASAWARARHPAVIEPWSSAIREARIATCSLVTLELLRTGRQRADLDAILRELALLRDVPVTVSVQRAAIDAVLALADQGPLHHRIPIPDALIAAAAQEAGVGVLHYDHQYDRLAEVLSFESRWIAKAGSL